MNILHPPHLALISFHLYPSVCIMSRSSSSYVYADWQCAMPINTRQAEFSVGWQNKSTDEFLKRKCRKGRANELTNERRNERTTVWTNVLTNIQIRNIRNKNNNWIKTEKQTQTETDSLSLTRASHSIRKNDSKLFLHREKEERNILLCGGTKTNLLPGSVNFPALFFVC